MHNIQNSRVSLGLINPKSATNVGVILRACGCYGATSVFYTGERFRHAKAFHTDTKNTHQHVPTIGVDDIMAMKPNGAKSVVIELVEGAAPLPAFTHPDNAYYVFGPEDGSVTQEVIDQADYVVYIPTRSSMNLAATANVVLYDRMAKRDYDAGDAFIRAARDTNNNSRVRQFDVD
ncbi:RNA methyltransferase [Alteromonas facilis]|uniref:RNA methyltransferase n=1 Tax=Alteromonas facilis TaxID=2048004 RepID=UPI0013DB11DD|nr:RNA methyltransferase [Alteromonas facilis]